MSTLLFRGLVLGLLLANTMILIELATPRACRHHRHRTLPLRVEIAPPGAPPAKAEPMRVVDVRREALEREGLTEMLGLGPGDRILSVNDEAVTGTAATLERIQGSQAEYIDLDINRRGRRVRTVVLLH